MGAPLTDIVSSLGSFTTNHPRMYSAMSSTARTVGGAALGNYMGRQESRAVNSQSMAQSNYIAQMNQRALQMQAENQAFLQGLHQNALASLGAARADSNAHRHGLQQQTLANQAAVNGVLGDPLVNNSGDYNGLLTLASSPQGDMSRPNLGRSRLVGS